MRTGIRLEIPCKKALDETGNWKELGANSGISQTLGDPAAQLDVMLSQADKPEVWHFIPAVTKAQVAAVTKIYGVLMTLLGAFVGGAMAMRWGVMRVLMLGALLSASSNLLFAWLAGQAPTTVGLTLVVSADNLAGGIASAAFIAYLSSLTNVQYSATQYALFSSMMLLAPKWLAGFSGVFVDTYGYEAFFHTTALMGFPVLLLIFLASRVKMGSDA